MKALQHRSEMGTATTWRILAALLTGNQPPAAPDWEAVVALAEQLQLSPLVYRLLRQRAAPDSLPAVLKGRLTQAYWLTLANNLRCQQRLAEIAHALADAGIPSMVLKGLALAMTIYPDLGTRGMSDLDLLVHEADADRAIALLQGLGYQPDTAHHPGHPPAFARHFDGQQVFFCLRRPGPAVELHWDLIDYEWFRATTRLSMEGLWPRSRPLTLGGITAQRLSPEDNLLYLCTHLAVHHGYSGARSLIDLDLAIRREPPDWTILGQRACTARLGTVVYFALRGAQQLLGTPIPAPIVYQLRPSRLVRWAVGRLADPAGFIQSRPACGPQALRLLHFFLVDRWSDRLRGLARIFFPGRAWLAARYSARQPGAVVLHTLLHPFRMLELSLQALSQLGLRQEVVQVTSAGGPSKEDRQEP